MGRNVAVNGSGWVGLGALLDADAVVEHGDGLADVQAHNGLFEVEAGWLRPVQILVVLGLVAVAATILI